MTEEYELVKVDAFTSVAVPKKPAPKDDKPKSKKVKDDADESEKPV